MVGHHHHHQGLRRVRPVTPVGRLVPVELIISGIALLGTVTATLATWFVERVQDTEVKSQKLTRAQIREMTAEMKALRADLASLTELIAPPAAAPDDGVRLGSGLETEESGATELGCPDSIRWSRPCLQHIDEGTAREISADVGRRGLGDSNEGLAGDAGNVR